MRGVVRFEDECPLAHGAYPLLRKRGCFQKPTSAFDLRQRIRDGVRDREMWLKTLLRHGLLRTHQNRKAGHRCDSSHFARNHPPEAAAVHSHRIRRAANHAKATAPAGTARQATPTARIAAVAGGASKRLRPPSVCTIA